jgi:transcriptional regulator with XRE-family HTH domain
VQNEPKDTKPLSVKVRRKSHRIGPSRRLGKVIKELRSARGLSQEDLAGLAKLDRTFVSMLERGIRRATLETAQALAKAFGITLAELIAEIG